MRAVLPRTPARRPVDVLGIIGVVLAAVGLLPSLAVLLIGLIPEMNPIWWLGIVLIPLLAVLGATAFLIGLVGMLVGRRSGGRIRLSTVAAVLGLVMLLPSALLLVA